MNILYIVCGGLLITSGIANRKKTLKALKIALKKLLKILPAFLAMIIFVSIVLFLIPQEIIVTYLGTENTAGSVGIAALIGSIAMMPGFIAFPLCGILRDSGVSWSVIAAFSNSLMLVGIVSFPVEKQFLGVKTAIVRNIIALLMSLIIAFVMGIIYGEVF